MGSPEAEILAIDTVSPNKIVISILKVSSDFQDTKDTNGPRTKWTIYTHVSDKSKKCLSVGNSKDLSVVFRLWTKSQVCYSS